MMIRIRQKKQPQESNSLGIDWIEPTTALINDIFKGLRMGYLISTCTDRNEHFIGGLKQQITWFGLFQSFNMLPPWHPPMLKQIALFELFVRFRTPAATNDNAVFSICSRLVCDHWCWGCHKKHQRRVCLLPAAHDTGSLGSALCSSNAFFGLKEWQKHLGKSHGESSGKEWFSPSNIVRGYRTKPIFRQSFL